MASIGVFSLSAVLSLRYLSAARSRLPRPSVLRPPSPSAANPSSSAATLHRTDCSLLQSKSKQTLTPKIIVNRGRRNEDALKNSNMNHRGGGKVIKYIIALGK
ncbi:hypothetical protein RIF29_21831 [Crotalaria pallida]|uniref:Uncharacterized protein n=1 Tax=Crotalaria pallida TaxID=3830 RepID=A0AAN9F870_CROPI